jgi:endoglucanase
MPLTSFVTRLLFIASACVSALSAQTFSDGPVAAPPQEPLPVIAVQGNRFVNQQGETVVFRGLALSDPASLQERGQWNRGYLEAARSWNANLVRFPVHPQAWRDLGERAYLQLLDDGIRWAGELGMYVIIDWHTIGNPLTDVYHRPNYITSRGETFRFWYTIASRYAQNPTVAFHELFNEPTNQGGRMGRMPWAEYRAYIEELVHMIRQINPRSIPLIAGFDWAYELRNIREDPVGFPGVAYVSHPYPQKRNPPWEAQWQADWGYVAETYPVICTEFGFMSADGRGAHVPVIGDETYGEALIAFLEKRGISWTPWVFDPVWSPQLIEDWDFTPTRQGRFFREKLQQLNQGASAPRR